jgi:hypothetical protein
MVSKGKKGAGPARLDQIGKRGSKAGWAFRPKREEGEERKEFFSRFPNTYSNGI